MEINGCIGASVVEVEHESVKSFVRGRCTDRLAPHPCDLGTGVASFRPVSPFVCDFLRSGPHEVEHER